MSQNKPTRFTDYHPELWIREDTGFDRFYPYYYRLNKFGRSYYARKRTSNPDSWRLYRYDPEDEAKYPPACRNYAVLNRLEEFPSLSEATQFADRLIAKRITRAMFLRLRGPERGPFFKHSAMGYQEQFDEV